MRFYKEEEKNEPEHAKALAKGIDYFVNDAFGTAHRAHASTAGIANYVQKSLAGFLLEKELAYLEGAVKAPKRPFVAIVSASFLQNFPLRLCLLVIGPLSRQPALWVNVGVP